MTNIFINLNEIIFKQNIFKIFADNFIFKSLNYL